MATRTNVRHPVVSSAPWGPFRDVEGNDLNHREDPVKVFENTVSLKNQKRIDKIYCLAKDLFCLMEELKGALDDKLVSEIRSDAADIAVKLSDKTSERLPQAYWYPENNENGEW